ncbi:MAG: alkaline phosphatase [Polaromonas sp.]|nr:alkaline phosphatase [Polaromonas sp.]
MAVTALALAASQAFAAGEAKNVILFVGDGMGPVTVTASRIYKHGEAGQLTMDTLPRTARVRTYSLDAQTTDSAPSMAAYMTGVKTRNDVISMDGNTVTKKPSADSTTSVTNAINNCPATGNGAASPTLLEQAIAKGKASGVVTTARLTHATPAVTYAHICNRDAEYDISRQAVPGGAGFNTALGTGVDVLLGGVSYYWRPFNADTTKRGRPDGRDLIAELQAKGYTAVSDLAGLNAAATDKRLVGLFDQAQGQGHMSYELDRDPAKEPSLAQMTTKAIEILSKNEKGYFLMVEGGRIDHALHGTNAKRALADTIAFDEAIKAALDKIDLSNTLVVVTADHDHTLAFNGYSHRGNDILGQITDVKTKKPVMAADGKPATTLVFGNGGTPRSDVRADITNVDTSGNKDYQQEVGVQLGSETHGGGDVMLFATGAGSKVFKGSIDNTKVFGLMRQAFGF